METIFLYLSMQTVTKDTLFVPLLLGCEKEKTLEDRLDEMLQTSKYVELLYRLDLDIVHIKEKLVEYTSRIKRWPGQYLKQQSTLDEKQGTRFEISDIIDIEENIWSPYFGFKGRYDCLFYNCNNV